MCVRERERVSGEDSRKFLQLNNLSVISLDWAEQRGGPSCRYRDTEPRVSLLEIEVRHDAIVDHFCLNGSIKNV